MSDELVEYEEYDIDTNMTYENTSDGDVQLQAEVNPTPTLQKGAKKMPGQDT